MGYTNDGDRLPTWKKCPSCNQVRHRVAFNKRRSRAGTVLLASTCRACHKLYTKAWHRAKKAGVSLTVAQWREATRGG